MARKVKFAPRDYIALAIILSLTVVLGLGYDGFLRATLVGVGLSYNVIVMPKMRR
jgi:hypothetical protein